MTARILTIPALHRLARRRRVEPSGPADRLCLLCSRTFPSAGAHHRICQPCKIGAAANQNWSNLK